jgi:integrase
VRRATGRPVYGSCSRTAGGKIERHDNIVARGLQALQIKTGIVKENGRGKYGTHALRHFFASWAIDQGFTPKRVQSLLGHSSIRMTLDVYGHLFPHSRFAAGELAIVGKRV